MLSSRCHEPTKEPDSGKNSTKEKKPKMETLAQDELKAHLMATDEHFRELCQQHSDYDHKVAELEAKSTLTEAEKVEEVKLKKLKLHLKDQIVEIMNRHRHEHVA
jgi:uncharacterized protein YdcH (DUF465 family)